MVQTFSTKGLAPDAVVTLKSSVNLIDVVSEHVVLKKVGGNFVGLCPFHAERSPSFSVSEKKQVYHCYGCKKGGDIVRFIQDMHGLSFREALKELAERAGAQVSPEIKKQLGEWVGSGGGEAAEARQREISTFYRLNRFIAGYFRKSLKDGESPQAHRYLEKRGLREHELEEFYVGVAPSGWSGLTDFLIDAQAPMDLAEKLGVIRQKQKSNQKEWVDLFRNRVMFPIIDLRGKVLGFGGRTLGDENPKYLNSSESAIFQKGTVLYGIFQAQKYIREENFAIVVEGYFDVIALHSAGFRNVVATCGTALTADHLKVLYRLGERVVLAFDNDKAGQDATIRAMELGLSMGKVLYSVRWPEADARDPDEILFSSTDGSLIPDGVDLIRGLLQSAAPVLDTRAAELIVEARQSVEAKSQALKQLKAWLKDYTDRDGRDLRGLDWAGKLQISPQMLVPEVVASTPTPARPSAFQSRPVLRPKATPVTGKAAKPEKLFAAQVLRAMVDPVERNKLKNQALPLLTGRLPEGRQWLDVFQHAELRELMTALTRTYAWTEGGTHVPQLDLDLESFSPGVRAFVTSTWAQTESSDEENTRKLEAEARIAVDRLVMGVWVRFSQEIREKLARAEASQDAGLHSLLLQEYLDVQRRMKEFDTFYDEV